MEIFKYIGFHKLQLNNLIMDNFKEFEKLCSEITDNINLDALIECRMNK